MLRPLRWLSIRGPPMIVLRPAFFASWYSRTDTSGMALTRRRSRPPALPLCWERLCPSAFADFVFPAGGGASIPGRRQGHPDVNGYDWKHALVMRTLLRGGFPRFRWPDALRVRLPPAHGNLQGHVPSVSVGRASRGGGDPPRQPSDWRGGHRLSVGVGQAGHTAGRIGTADTAGDSRHDEVGLFLGHGGARWRGSVPPDNDIELKARDGQGALQCRRQETTRRRPGVFGARGGIGVERWAVAAGRWPWRTDPRSLDPGCTHPSVNCVPAAS